MEDPTAAEVSQVSIVTEWTFQILYTVEMCLKIIGLGLIWSKEAYLKDAWNVLDFVIVMSAWLTIIQAAYSPDESSGQQTKDVEEGLSLSSLRAFRVLRPLRAITSIEELKVLVSSVLKALPLLGDAILVLIFFFLILSGYLL